MRPLVALTVVAIAACEERTYEIDAFPLEVDFTAGVPLGMASAPDVDEDVRVVVLDTASPLTLFDDGAEAPLDQLAATLTLHEVTGGARARFRGVDILIAPAGTVGRTGVDAASGTTVAGVIGADVLKRVAVRIDATAGQVSFFPDVAGDSTTLEASCRAVLDAPLVGGGDFRLGEQDVHFDATRVVAGACLGLAPTPRVGQDPTAPLDRTQPVPQEGRDALLVIATGVPITILTRTAYEGAGGTPLAASPDLRIHMPGGGAVDARRGTIRSLALAHDEESTRGPCEEVAASRVMERCGCQPGVDNVCPCGENDDLCSAGASVELGWTRDVNEDDMTVVVPAIEVAVVEDTHPLIQGFRRELSPQVADIDGLLGMDLLGRFVADLDYPHGRIILRCADETDPTCLARPRITDQASRDERARCLADLGGGSVCD